MWAACNSGTGTPQGIRKIGSSTGPDRSAHRVFWNVFENIRAKAIASYMDEGTEAGTQSSFPFDTNAAYVLSRAPYMMNEISASTSVKSS